MRTPGPQPIELLSPTGHRVGGKPALDAADRPAVPQDPVLRQPADDGVFGAFRGDGQLSPGASKPATRGRFKTSHNSYVFRTRSLILTGSTRCSKCQATTGLLFPPGNASLGPVVRFLSGPLHAPGTAQTCISDHYATAESVWSSI